MKTMRKEETEEFPGQERRPVWRLLGAIGAPFRWLLISSVRLYQMLLSPLIPFHCRFRPTCSRYFIEAVHKHGAVRGSLLGIWRILRCQPLCKGGDDPVP